MTDIMTTFLLGLYVLIRTFDAPVQRAAGVILMVLAVLGFGLGGIVK